MKKYKLIAIFLILSIIFSPLFAYAKGLTINGILKELTEPGSTSLQRLDLMKQYKGQTVKGVGKVKDILKSFSVENEALVYVEKPFEGKTYEIVLPVNLESAKKIKKGRRIKFEGKFEGMAFENIRLKDGKIIEKRWWIF